MSCILTEIAESNTAAAKYLIDTDPVFTSASNIPDYIFFSLKDMEVYRKLKEEIASKSHEQLHKEAQERWNNGQS